MSSTTTDDDNTDLIGNLNSALSSADGTAGQRLQNLNLVHNARLAQLSRAAASATRRYGKGSPQATSAEAAVTASKSTNARIAITRQQVTTPAPQVPAAGWVLHGRVFDAQLKPVSACTVYLVDSQNNYQSAYGFAYTDSTGYFLLSFAGQSPPAQGGTAPPADAAPAASSGLFIAIANAKAQPVYLGATAFAPALGMATYQNTTLPAGASPIGDPPESIRQSALPSADAADSADEAGSDGF
jgi:hypothetical protein